MRVSVPVDRKSMREVVAATLARALRLEQEALAIGPSVTGVFVTALLLGVIALTAYQHEGLTLVDGDSAGHLYIARRTIESLTPSFAQLGGIWLPLPHVLLIPLIWEDHLWETGLAGGIMSTVATAAAVAYVYATARSMSGHALAAILAAALFATNSNLMYMQTTAMTEPLTLLIIVAATYHTLEWTKTASFVQLLLSAIWVLGGTLVRYEMWALVPAGASIVAFTGWRRNGWRAAEGLTLFWTTVASYGVVLWLIYGQVVFGDALNFMRGFGTGSAFAAEKSAQGLLPYKDHPLVAMKFYGWAAVDNLGVPLVAVGTLGAVLLLTRRIPLAAKLAALLPVTLFLFEIASLTIGQSAMGNPHANPPQFVNSRYGLLMLPAAALLASQLAVRLRSVGVALLVVALAPQIIALPGVLSPRASLEDAAHADITQLAQRWRHDNFPFLQGGQQITMYDAVLAGGLDKPEVNAGSWLRDHDPGGPILISTVRNDAALLMMDSGLEVARFVTEGNKPYFGNALGSPSTVSVIAYEPYSGNDRLRPLFRDGPPEGFQLAFDNGTFELYTKTPAETAPRPPTVHLRALPVPRGSSFGFTQLPRGVAPEASYDGFALSCDGNLLSLATRRRVFFAETDCAGLYLDDQKRAMVLGGAIRVQFSDAGMLTIFSDRGRLDVWTRGAWSMPVEGSAQ